MAASPFVHRHVPSKGCCCTADVIPPVQELFLSGNRRNKTREPLLQSTETMPA